MENKREKKKGSHVLYNQGLRLDVSRDERNPTPLFTLIFIFFLFNSFASNKIDRDEKVMGPELSRVRTKSMYRDYDN